MQYNCQKSSNFQGLSHFSRIFGKNDKIPGFFQAGKTVTIFPGFPGAVGTLHITQGKNEKVRQFAGQLEAQFKRLMEKVLGRCDNSILKEQFFHGMHQHLKDSIRFCYKWRRLHRGIIP